MAIVRVEEVKPTPPPKKYVIELNEDEAASLAGILSVLARRSWTCEAIYTRLAKNFRDNRNYELARTTMKDSLKASYSNFPPIIKLEVRDV